MTMIHQILQYMWHNAEKLNEEWLAHFSLGQSGPPRKGGRRGFEDLNIAVTQLQQILDSPNSSWVALLLRLGIPQNTPLEPRHICQLPQSKHCCKTAF